MVTAVMGVPEFFTHAHTLTHTHPFTLSRMETG